MSDRIQLEVGEALATMRRLEPPFDAIFLDADKARLPTYLDESLRLLRVGGLLLCDNTFLDGRVADDAESDPDVVGMREYNRMISTDARLVSAVIPVRDGLAISLKVRD